MARLQSLRRKSFATFLEERVSAAFDFAKACFGVGLDPESLDREHLQKMQNVNEAACPYKYEPPLK